MIRVKKGKKNGWLTLLVFLAIFSVAPNTHFVAYALNFTEYNSSNSDLPFNYLSFVEVTDEAVWVVAEGLVKFDGSDWTVFDTTNSELPSTEVSSLVEVAGLIWIGTDKGLVSYSGVEWNVFNTENSVLPSNRILSLATDEGILWVGTDEGLSRFSDDAPALFNTDNSDLPSNRIQYLAADEGIIWVGTGSGLASFDQTSWITYTTTNSELPFPSITYIATSEDAAVWVGGRTLVRYDGVNWEVKEILSGDLSDGLGGWPGHNYVFTSSDNVIWVGIQWVRLPFGDYPMLKRIDGNGWDSFSDREVPFQVNDITTDEESIWAATDDGLVKWDVKVDGSSSSSSSEWSDCFIATAAYGTPMATEIDALRALRDQKLMTNETGRSVVEAYYRLSPPAAELISQSDTARSVVRKILRPVVAISSNLKYEKGQEVNLK